MPETKFWVGNAPCSWGTLEFEGLTGERIGYAQMLDELVETGYVGTELGDWGFMPTEPDALKAELSRRRVEMWGAFVDVNLCNADAHDEGIERCLRIARLLAAVSPDQERQPFLVLADKNGTDPIRTKNAGRVSAAMMLSDDKWRTFAQAANRIAKVVNEETGLHTVFHHHCAGYVETPDEIARLLDLTDPKLLGLVFDSGHYAFAAGENGCNQVLDGLNRFADRIWYVHFKDCHPAIAAQSRQQGWDYFESVRQGVFCELGQGGVDFAAIVAWLHQHRYDAGILVEQDVLPGMGKPKASARRNRDYLASLGL